MAVLFVALAVLSVVASASSLLLWFSVRDRLGACEAMASAACHASLGAGSPVPCDADSLVRDATVLGGGADG